MIQVANNFKQIRISIALAALILVFSPTAFCGNDKELEESLARAIRNTIVQGGFSYELTSRSVNSYGDTCLSKIKVTAINTNKESGFAAHYHDSIKVVYHDNRIVSAITNRDYYNEIKVKPKNLNDYKDFGFQIFSQQDFATSIVNKSTTTEKVFEDDRIKMYKVGRYSKKDIEDVFYIFTVSKNSDKVIKYKYSGSVLNGKRWFELSINSTSPLTISEAKSYIEKELYSIKSSLNLRKISPNLFRARSVPGEIQQLIREIPKYDLVSLYGEVSNFKAIKSKFYLVFFWKEHCPPCENAMFVLNELRNSYSVRDLRILSINSRDKRVDGIHDYVVKHSIAYEVYTSGAREGDTLREFNRTPYFIIYNAKYKVVAVFSGFNDHLKDRLTRVVTSEL